MPLVPAKCTVCGAVLSIESTKEAAVCQSCGNAFVVENAINNYNTYNNTVNNITADTVIVNAESEKEQLYRNAETFRKLGRYEKAKSYYDNLVKDFSDDWRGWWGLILCETEDFTVLSKEERTSYLFSVVQKLVPAEQTEAVLNNYKVYLQTASELAAEDDMEKVKQFLNAESIETDPTVLSFNSQLKNIEQNCQLNVKKQDGVIKTYEADCDNIKQRIEGFERSMRLSNKLFCTGIVALVIAFLILLWSPANLKSYLDNGGNPFSWSIGLTVLTTWGVVTCILLPRGKRETLSKLEDEKKKISANGKLILEAKKRKNKLQQDFSEEKVAVEQEKQLYIEQKTAECAERTILCNEYIALGTQRLAAYHFAKKCNQANIPAENDESVELLRSKLFAE